MERVEGVEELFLGRLLARDELHVVHQEHVELPVAALELVHPLEAQCVDEVVQETLGRQVQDARIRVEALDFLGDRVHEVGLAEPDAAVEKERVVRARRRFGHRARGGMGELVGRPDDEALEGEARIGHDRSARAGCGHGGRDGRRVGGAGFEPDLELRKTGGRGLAGEQCSVARLDPVRENPRRDRYRQDSSAGRGIEGNLSGRPEPGVELLRIELFLDLLEDGRPDLGH